MNGFVELIKLIASVLILWCVVAIICFAIAWGFGLAMSVRTTVSITAVLIAAMLVKVVLFK